MNIVKYGLFLFVLCLLNGAAYANVAAPPPPIDVRDVEAQVPASNRVVPLTPRTMWDVPIPLPPMQVQSYVPPASRCAPAQACCNQVGAYWKNSFSCTSASMKDLGRYCCNLAWLKPIPRRIAGILALGGISAGAAYLFVNSGLPVFSTLIQSTAAFVFINGTETMLSLAALFYSTPAAVRKTTVEEKSQIAVVIPVHGAHKKILPTIRSLLRLGLRPEQLFIMENTGGKYGIQDSQVRKDLNSQPQLQGIRYHYIDAFGNKVAAAYLGLELAQQRGYLYAAITDDDVTFPHRFDFSVGLLNETYRLVAYPIKPQKANGFFVRMQKQEYRRSDRHNYFKDFLGTVLAPHGAVSFGYIDTLLEALRNVDGAFFAEDQKLGDVIRQLGYKIRMAPHPAVTTEVPENLADLLRQRLKSWDIGAHLSTPMYVRDFFLDVPRGCEFSELVRFALLKAYQLQAVYTNVQDIIRPILFVSLYDQWLFWVIVGAVIEANALIGIADDAYFSRRMQPEKSNISFVKLLKSVANQHLNGIYSFMQFFNGTIGGLCCCIGAGAASPADFPLKQGYPRELVVIFKEKDPVRREQLMQEYLARAAPAQDIEADLSGLAHQAQ